jgi:hypothetical protein
VAPKAQHTTMVGLPVQVVSPTDLGRLIRELEKLDDLLHQAELRQEAEVKMPHTSRLLDKTLELNKINLLTAAERRELLQFLEAIKAKAPVLHMSFSADPPAVFLEKVAGWFRKEIHPLALVTVGLQPNIGAGCVLRTKNKYFDLSLRKDFDQKKDLLREAISEKVAPPPQAPMPSAEEARAIVEDEALTTSEERAEVPV